MDFNKLIHDYVDTGLNNQSEDKLFEQLAHDRELRSELHQHLKLNNIAKDDMAMITPPLESTNAIFAQLGFSMPTTAATVGGAVASSGISHLFKQYSGFIATALISSVVTLLLMVGVDYMGNGSEVNISNNKANSSSNKSANQVSKDVNSNTQNIPIVSSNEISSETSTNNSSFNTNSEKTVNTHSTVKEVRNIVRTKYIVLDRNSGKIQELNKNQFENLVSSTNSQNTEISEIKKEVVSENKVLESNFSLSELNLNYSNHDLSKINENSNVSSSLINDARTSFFKNQIMIIEPEFLANNSKVTAENNTELYFKTNNSNSYSKNSSSNTNSFNDFAIGFSYYTNPWLAYSVDLGYESFSILRKDFSGADVNPVLWVGGSARFIMPDLIFKDKIQAFSKLTLAASGKGPLAKGLLGISLTPETKYGFFVGYEHSILLQNYKDLNLNTNKSNVVIGFNYRW